MDVKAMLGVGVDVGYWGKKNFWGGGSGGGGGVRWGGVGSGGD